MSGVMRGLRDEHYIGDTVQVDVRIKTMPFLTRVLGLPKGISIVAYPEFSCPASPSPKPETLNPKLRILLPCLRFKVRV